LEQAGRTFGPGEVETDSIRADAGPPSRSAAWLPASNRSGCRHVRKIH